MVFGYSIILAVQPQESIGLMENSRGDEGLAVQFSDYGAGETGNWMSLSAGYHTHVGLRKKVNRLRGSGRSPFNPFTLLDPTVSLRKEWKSIGNRTYVIQRKRNLTYYELNFHLAGDIF